MDPMTRLWSWAMCLLEDRLPALMLALATAIVTADVAGRYLLSSPIRGASETATVLFILAAMLGAAGVARRHAHVGVNLLPQALHGRPRAAVLLIADLVVVIVAVLMVFAGWEYIVASQFATIPVLGIPTRFVAVVLPLTFLLIAIHYAWRVPGRLRALRNGDDLPVALPGMLDDPGGYPAEPGTPR